MELQSLYSVGETLGRGTFGTAKRVKDLQNGDTLCVKSIAKRKLVRKEDIDDVKREIQIMHHLAGVKHIVQLHGAYEDKNNVHLVMELAEGGELFDRIVAHAAYSEKDAAAICRTMLEMLQECHNLGVMHRDIKPENFLLRDKSDNAELMLTDFGLSRFVKPGVPLNEIAGSAFYIAPEVLRRNYGIEADVWSIGVILYILLSGAPPFWGENEPRIFDAILKADLDFCTEPWPAVSDDAKEVISGMLTRDPRQRWTIPQVLNHKWMRGNARDTPLDSAVLKRLQHFTKMNKLKRRALQIIAGSLTQDEIAGLKNLFEAIDKDRSGSITFNELKDGLMRQGCSVTEQQLKEIMADVDADGNGTLDLDEFIAATMHIYNAVKDENLVNAFRSLDMDGSGFLTTGELKAALVSNNSSISDDEINNIIKDVDKNHDGKIDYEEFATMMREELPGLKQLRSRVRV